MRDNARGTIFGGARAIMAAALAAAMLIAPADGAAAAIKAPDAAGDAAMALAVASAGESAATVQAAANAGEAALGALAPDVAGDVTPVLAAGGESVLATPESVRGAAYERSFNSRGKSVVKISAEQSWYRSKRLTYIKLRPSETGYVTLKLERGAGAKRDSLGQYVNGTAEVTFCDKSKQNLGEPKERYSLDPQERDWFEEEIPGFHRSACYTRTYAVKKNTTYYFKVKAIGAVKLTATVKAQSAGTNTSRTFATRFHSGKEGAESGIFFAQEKNAYWYRIDLNQPAKIKISYSIKTSGNLPKGKIGIRVTFRKADGTMFYSNSSGKSESFASNINLSGWAKYYRVEEDGNRIDLLPGIYYVKVEPATARSSGFYKISWKAY